MVADEAGGRWQRAAGVQPPANAADGASRWSLLFSLTWLAGRSCAAVGFYLDTSGDHQAMATAVPLP